MNHHKPTNGFDKRTPDELKDISRKAGVASGKARRKKRRRIDREKVRQQARAEWIHEQVMDLRRAARALRTATDAEQLR